MTSAASVLAPPTIDPALLGHYEGLEDPVVVGFLAGHPRLVALLVDAIPQVERIFGEGARIELRPEAEYSGSLTLYATVRADLPHEELLARFNHFSDIWWIHQDRSGGPLAFDVGQP